MKILFDHQTFTSQSYGGISRYFVRLAQNLLLQGEKVDILAPVYRNNYLRELPCECVHGFMLSNYPPKTTRLISSINSILSSHLLKKNNLDILHETYYTTRPINVNLKGRVLTVYDMIHERFQNEFHPSDLTSKIKKVAVSRADHIICISNSTKRDLCELFEIPDEKVSVVHLGFDNFSEISSIITPRVYERPFLLYVGNRGGYKNFLRMLTAISSSTVLQSSFDVVAFGGGKFNRQEEQHIQSLRFKPNTVRQISGNDQILGELYRGAAALVYPSLYEGFGLPPLEAMAHGCPVVASNTSSMPEVIGCAGEYFSPFDVESQANAISKVVLDSEHRNVLISAGKRQLDKFSWQECAIKTREIYATVLNSKE